MKTTTIQWYPGHIAKAENQLSKNLAKVDLIIEVRDARIPISTSHPHLERWIKGKQHLLVINRRDMISPPALQAWDESFRKKGLLPVWCNAKDGTGVKQLQQQAIKAGEKLNERRISRGMKSRPVRALTTTFFRTNLLIRADLPTLGKPKARALTGLFFMPRVSLRSLSSLPA